MKLLAVYCCRDILGIGGPGRGGWVAAPNDDDAWFMVDFRDWREVRGVITQVMKTVKLTTHFLLKLYKIYHLLKL